ncbi:MAG: hypothetical protein E7513_00525 [Ruminococcaceae bacterium]|nr:hypothetical protein [Oscillospiraceae bacterium]
MKKTSFKVSFGGIIGALSIVMMLLTSVIPFGTFAFPAIAGMLLVCVVIELGYSWAFIVYTVVSVLSLLLLTDKEAAVYYIAFLGFYPIIKGLIEKLSSKILQYIIKYAVFNACMVIAFFVSVYLFSIPKESFEIFSVYLPWVFLIIGNFIFIIYDYCISKIVTIYLLKLHKLLSNKTKM